MSHHVNFSPGFQEAHSGARSRSDDRVVLRRRIRRGCRGPLRALHATSGRDERRRRRAFRLTRASLSILFFGGFRIS